LRLSWLWRAPETRAGRLLRVLQLWLRAMSADSNRCAMLCVNAAAFLFWPFYFSLSSRRLIE
ncbi:MAG: hypothetical protein M3O66_01720, partial [Verrucomicrobiota bacterium]|nr:hypothetical protein [Verrucomicrobiota bacterium]